ncbi:cell adhesion molecule CEACAM5 [Nelusetta ayraudi]|uniref:cell adhesion molecule CEACAM5 n=1 Tax=Nelusetta ayraudi TaxID=303726 RepID=UPI003F71F60F
MAPPPPLLLLLLTLAGSSWAQDLLPDGPVDAVLGRNVTLKTLVKPVYTFIVWNFNDGTEQVHIATRTETGLNTNDALYKDRVSVDPVTGSLTLTALRADESGDYSITIIKEDGSTLTAEIKLRVLEPVSEVSISSNLAEVIEVNSTLVLTCSAKGSFLTFTWNNGSTPLLATSSRVSIKEAETSSTLTIIDVLRSDLSRPLSCTAANKLEMKRSAPFNFTMFYGPDGVTISPSSPPSFIASGGSFNLSCGASSWPTASFSWYREKQKLEHFQEVLPQKVLEVYGLNKPPASYTCMATNTKTGRAVLSPAVTLGIMASITSITLTGPSGAPLLAGNSSANLSCAASGGPVSKTTWTKDGQQLPLSSRMTLVKNETLLIISPLQPEDNGDFSCKLENKVSSKTATISMEVYYGPDSATVSGEEAVEVNDPVMLSCSAPSMPLANFSWTFNGSSLVDMAKPVLTIDKAVYKNSGTYECKASNTATGKIATARHLLAVKEEGALDEGLSDGAIAGIVIGVLVALAAAIALVIYCRQKVPVESPY